MQPAVLKKACFCGLPQNGLSLKAKGFFVEQRSCSGFFGILHNFFRCRKAYFNCPGKKGLRPLAVTVQLDISNLHLAG